jgi:hypothetical protein
MGTLKASKKKRISWGFSGRGWVGVGGFARFNDDEVVVGMVGGAVALGWRKVRAVLEVMAWH